jgi:dipeptidyl aminopeptidase/acylaminoacyl peptidase
MSPTPPPETRPHGSWPSPLQPDHLARSALSLAAPALADDGSLYWLEGRPDEGGRTAIVRRDPQGAVADVTPAPFYVRSRVHEYGGGAYVVASGSGGPTLYFVNDADQAVYQQRPPATPTRLTPADPDGGPRGRFADLVLDPARPRLLAVAERHGRQGEPENLLVAIDRQSGAVEVLVRGADFYASPTPSPDGRRLAWLSWNHPHMPWDAATLHVADLDAAGRPGPARAVAGHAGASAQQPAFGPDGALWFLYEGNGFWNLWREGSSGAQPVLEMQAELTQPLWQLGLRTWAFVDGGQAVLIAPIATGSWQIQRFDRQTRELRPLAKEITAVDHVSARGDRVVLLAQFADRAPAVVELDLAGDRITVVREALALELDPSFVSRPEAIAYPTSDGDTAHGFFYPPHHPTVRPPPGEKPPLLVLVHGGPTAAFAPAFAGGVQFWTTRGFAVLEVNYRGSTGYGRRYRDRLNGKWGVYDVDDCVAGARALARAGRIDPARVAIRGGSAGGYTVLAALVGPGRDCFAAGASLYGISDLGALVRDTHKFESRYCEALIAPLAEHPEVYVERSPITHADRLRCPVIFFQGLEDKVVPPDQTERLVQALRSKGLPTEYHAFPGEQHGFRRADTRKKVLEAELAFYGRVLGFAT